MKKISHKNKTREELEKTISENRMALKNFRFGGAGSKIKNIKEGVNLRKDIARMLTELKNLK